MDMDWNEVWVMLCAVFLAVCAGEAINTNQRVKEILAKIRKKEKKEDEEAKINEVVARLSSEEKEVDENQIREIVAKIDKEKEAEENSKKKDKDK